MKKTFYSVVALMILSGVVLVSCTNKEASAEEGQAQVEKAKYGGYASRETYGEHLVTICGCNDCHTPKVMSPHGMQFDSTRMLSGHPADLPALPVNRKEMEAKGIISTNDLTVWAGPWGVSYTANLTPDATGIGSWDEETFFRAIRMGKFKGSEHGRSLLPPMPWEIIRHMTDDELSAVFAYLKSIKPIKNQVPNAEPPALAQQQAKQG